MKKKPPSSQEKEYSAYILPKGFRERCLLVFENSQRLFQHLNAFLQREDYSSACSLLKIPPEKNLLPFSFEFFDFSSSFSFFSPSEKEHSFFERRYKMLSGNTKKRVDTALRLGDTRTAYKILKIIR